LVKTLATETHEANGRIATLMTGFTTITARLVDELNEGTRQGQAARKGVERIAGTVDEVAGAVGRVDGLTAEIAEAMSTTGGNVTLVRSALGVFGEDAKSSGEQLLGVERSLGQLERLSNDMLDQLAHSELGVYDRRFVAIAMNGMAAIRDLVERAIASGEVSEGDVFDNNYRAVAGSGPPRFTTRFTQFAGRIVQPVLDRICRDGESQIDGAIITDANGYLPTHVSWMAQPVRPDDPAWTAQHSRHHRIDLDEATARALRYEGDFILNAYRQVLDGGRYRMLKSVYVPLHLRGRRWGNFEMTYTA
jgi:methyl-accepting chemotaxis protein